MPTQSSLLEWRLYPKYGKPRMLYPSNPFPGLLVGKMVYAERKEPGRVGSYPYSLTCLYTKSATLEVQNPAPSSRAVLQWSSQKGR